eukprot:CAMPEP_0179909358 /NCGR_PEP_ID=MMETSP0982-20121206/45176_1 /TAXON_ID=483367 /ORGANISM="non described non described, Strain CCMP 2436" /LENGTH=67 /DNA_ID=CAMNT_0021810809 /DNA_START=306 /DNA_END=509 /DNA_ORIENTATION=+
MELQLVSLSDPMKSVLPSGLRFEASSAREGARTASTRRSASTVSAMTRAQEPAACSEDSQCMCILAA